MIPFLLLFLSSCLNNEAKSVRDVSQLPGEIDDSERPGEGSGAAPGDGSLDPSEQNFERGMAEIRHIVDPFDGTYKTKLTIPKNFRGLLYLSGLNITSLSDEIVKVRFRFGRDMEPIVIPATVGRAPGITPQTDIEVLILDMNNRPFQNVRLLYDLFDYNDYRDENGEETLPPTQNPRDPGLYCRGLRLEHDPTFQGSLSNSLCQNAGQTCLYAYAKIRDSGLFDARTNLYLNPSLPQIDTTGDGYENEAESLQLKKCLPDNIDKENTQEVLQADASNSGDFLTYGESLFFGGDYQYRGPYRALNTHLWEIEGDALLSAVDEETSASGIFQYSMYANSPLLALKADAGYGSFLFPRGGRLELDSNIEHFSHPTDPFGLRALNVLTAGGETGFVDGCNIRMMNRDTFSGEGISSCNVTATIELLTRSRDQSRDQVRAVTTAVKLQLIRPSLTNFEGQEVLYTSLKTCSSSNSCGPNECCFNQRCWSKDIVSQCREDVDMEGHLGIGEPCQSDFQCASLCCNRGIGSCQVHINTDQEQVLCSKPPGESCVTREYCRKENITHWFVVKTGVSPNGIQQCALRSFNIPTLGDCRNGVCIPPEIPPIPPFDPNDPDACRDAIDPPTSF